MWAKSASALTFFCERELSAAHFSALSEKLWARSQISERLPICTYINCWKWKTSPTSDDEIRPDNQDSGPFTGIRSSGPPIGGPLLPAWLHQFFVPFPPPWCQCNVQEGIGPSLSQSIHTTSQFNTVSVNKSLKLVSSLFISSIR
jgi:hypothetical protein